MPTDLNNVEALADDLAKAFSRAVRKGAVVRVDEHGEMIVTYERVERARVHGNGEIVECDSPTAPPLSSLLRRPDESQAEAEKRVLGGDGPDGR
jgi:hypothetical protein